MSVVYVARFYLFLDAYYFFIAQMFHNRPNKLYEYNLYVFHIRVVDKVVGVYV